MLALGLGLTADAAGLGVDTTHLKTLYIDLARADAGPHSTVDINQGYGFTLLKASDAMRRLHSWAAERNPNNQPDELLGARDAATLVGVDDSTIRDWQKKKGLGAHGPRNLVSKRELLHRLSELHQRRHRK